MIHVDGRTKDDRYIADRYERNSPDIKNEAKAATRRKLTGFTQTWYYFRLLANMLDYNSLASAPIMA